MSRQLVIRALVLPIVLAALLIALRLGAISGGPTVLISDGYHNPSHELIEAEFSHPYEAPLAGFDGAQYYAIARSPLDVKQAAKYVDPPTYRLRRILYPALAGALAPQGGNALIWAMAFVSLVGVGIGGWALFRLPGAPPWLPLAMVVNPGVIAGLWLSLGDVLATGLVIAAFSLLFARRFAFAVGVLALACLTREISVLAAFALMATPGLTRRQRLTIGIVPCIPVGLWSLYVSETLHKPLFAQPYGGTFTAPFLGWFHNDATGIELLVAAVIAAVLGASLSKWRTTPVPVTAYVAMSLAILVCSTPIIMDTWMGSTRVVSAALPLAIWSLVGDRSKRRAVLSPLRPA